MEHVQLPLELEWRLTPEEATEARVLAQQLAQRSPSPVTIGQMVLPDVLRTPWSPIDRAPFRDVELPEPEVLAAYLASLPPQPNDDVERNAA